MDSSSLVANLYRIVVDGLGGDFAPDEFAHVIPAFLDKFKDTEIYFSSGESLYAQIQKELKNSFERFHWIDGPEKVGFEESPVRSLKKKKNSSILKAVEAMPLVSGDALVSFGHTGATVAASHFALGMIEGVDRPGMAVIIPNEHGHGILMDVGANLHCKPEHLLQYSIMASVYCSKVLKVQPKVGLLNVGEEKNKGDRVLKKAHAMMKEACPAFVGNVEGGQVFDGSVDAVICGGITGNILLKSAEGLAKLLFNSLVNEFESETSGEAEQKKSSEILKEISRRHHPDFRGAGRLLGVKGLVWVGHGNARREAIFNALAGALLEVRTGLQSELKTKLAEY